MVQVMKRFDHVAIAVADLNEAIILYRDVFSFTFLGTELVSEQQVRVAFFELSDFRLELLEATSEESPIARFIKKRGEGIHHLAFKTDDLALEVSELEKSGVHFIGNGITKGAAGSKVQFAHPKATLGTLIELCED